MLVLLILAAAILGLIYAPVLTTSIAAVIAALAGLEYMFSGGELTLNNVATSAEVEQLREDITHELQQLRQELEERRRL